MLSLSRLKMGVFVKIGEEPYVIISAQHVKMGRGGAILRTKVKNLITGNVLEKTFRGQDKIEEADLTREPVSFLYKDERACYFMDNKTFEEFQIDKAALGHRAHLLKEGSEVQVFYFEGRAVNIELPAKVELKVTDSPPGVRGDTAQGSITKPVILETGLVIKAPLFIKAGEVVKINTETAEYVERV